MIVREMIAKLEQEDPEAEVHYAYDYGDHWNTEVAPGVGYVGPGEVVYSDYHRMDKLVEEDGDGDGKVRSVVILSQHP